MIQGAVAMMMLVVQNVLALATIASVTQNANGSIAS